MVSRPAPLPADPAAASHEELPDALRKRLSQLYQYGNDKRKQGDHDYAHSMYAQCVGADPSNLVYVEALLENLNTKYESRKKKCRVKANRAPFKKALAGAAWREVLQLGPELLRENPWDVATLRGLAQACAALHFNEVELRYLKNALDAAPRDVDVNRHCATSLARMGQIDQAIACWHRIEDAVKSEALKMISELTVAKTRLAAGLVDDEPPRTPAKTEGGTATAAATRPLQRTGAAATTSPPRNPAVTAAGSPSPPTRQQLEAAIARNPEDVAPYMELAELLDQAGEYREAEQVLRRVLPVSGNDLKVLERLERAQIRRSKSHLARAEDAARAAPSTAAQEQLQRARQHHNRLELDIYGARAQRYPDDLAIRYELGVRLKRAGNFAEAAQYFAQAAAATRVACPAHLARGECLQQMRQYTAALGAYRQAAEADAAGEHEESRKLALYRAGVLAVGLKDPDRARELLQSLVTLDPGYRDAQRRLEDLK